MRLSSQLFAEVRRVAGLATLFVACAVALPAQPASGQTTLGELLDAGAAPLSVEDFKREVVQQILVGRTGGGAELELMYAENGSIVGHGTPPTNVSAVATQRSLTGQWSAGSEGKICTVILFQEQHVMRSPAPSAPRCQYWFKLGDAYYISDSDTDRRAKVLRRTLKQAVPAGAGTSPVAQRTLGDLLDAGATKLSKQQVLDALNGATVSGGRPDGGTFQAVYKADGTYTGSYLRGHGALLIAKGGGFFGKWTVDDDGKFCDDRGIFLDRIVEQWPYPASSAGTAAPDTNCAFVFRLGDEFYAAASESNRSAPAFKRVVKR
jgi:hypothetical protein